MGNYSSDIKPSLLIVDSDKRTRSIFEAFFSRVGWALESWDGQGPVQSAPLKNHFDLLIADVDILETGSIKQLRHRGSPSSLVPLVVLIDSSTSAQGLAGENDVWCCIDKACEQKAIESSLEVLVGEFQRLRRDGTPAQRHRRPAEASVTIESFSSRELANGGYHFPILIQLENAGLLGISDKSRLQLALQEAIVNSLEHGNLELASEWKEEIDNQGIDKFSRMKIERLTDPHYGERIVTIVSDFDCSRILLRITDQGKGFKVPESNSITSRERTLAVFGRGLAIINNTMDEVVYSLGGRQITLIKKIFAHGVE